MTGTSTSTGRNGGLAQREEVELRVPCEHQARVEKAVDARGLVRIAAIERKALVPEPGDGPHNAVRFEDSDPAVRAERRRHRAEGMGLQESIGLEQPPTLKTDAADPFPPKKKARVRAAVGVICRLGIL